MSTVILGIESSCDDTSAAVISDRRLLSNIVSGQDVHKAYGGVVPELASRAHQQNIIPVVHQALKEANTSVEDIQAVAFTRGPGLLGSLLVGTSFVKGFALARGIKMIDINHLHAHVLVHFIETETNAAHPSFPFLTLLVSGGHSQLVLVHDYLKMEILGHTIDDAAGEAFDKCAKIMGLQYPGGPMVDKLAVQGDPERFTFSKPRIEGFDYSFSGLKTSFLYFLRDELKKDPGFIERNRNDLAASLQHTIIEILMDKLIAAALATGVYEIALAGGVSANSGLRNALLSEAVKRDWKTYIPPLKFTTDNAAMIAIAGHYKYKEGLFAEQGITPLARLHF